MACCQASWLFTQQAPESRVVRNPVDTKVCDLPNIIISYHHSGSLPSYFSLHSVYDMFPLPSLLYKWGLREDMEFNPCGQRRTLASILLECHFKPNDNQILQHIRELDVQEEWGLHGYGGGHVLNNAGSQAFLSQQRTRGQPASSW